MGTNKEKIGHKIKNNGWVNVYERYIEEADTYGLQNNVKKAWRHSF